MLYAITIFLSSFLLFLVQPLIARLILPWFGGTAAVWTTCMLFFQCILLAGYAYAHATSAKLGPRGQAILHTILLAAAAATLPILPDPSWKPEGGGEPISRILLLLTATVGLPYLLISSTSPLVQAWFSRARPGANPYRLFAVSNFASLLALVGYPLFVEPNLTNGQQVYGWSTAAKAQPGAVADASAVVADAPAPRGREIALWLALSATGSVILLAVTNHITQNIAAIPLLWLAPLTLYLLTFILCFEGQGLYRQAWWWPVVLAAVGAMAWLLVEPDHQFDLYVQLGVFLTGLFIACMFCHGELYRLRPANRHLTAFYLWVSVGGALGGLFVAVVAPLAFKAYYELGIGLAACALLAAIVYRSLNLIALGASLVLLLGTTGAVTYDAIKFQDYARLTVRNFYGVLRVKEYGTEGEEDHLRRLLHGTIMHGEQYMNGSKRQELTSYYQVTSGIGKAIASKQAGGPIRVGVVGLGTGTLAGYGRKGDFYKFYDINPAVVTIARSDFKYLGDSEAKIEVALGDARLTLERDAPEKFDVLAVDAFSSDSIPVHLITREALAVYLRHMKPGGIIAFHVSNRFLNLGPVVGQLARISGAHAVSVYEKGEEDRTQSDWVLVSLDRKALEDKVIKDVSEPVEERPLWRLWTDDYNNLVQILK